MTLEAIRVEDSWSVFALSGLRTLAPASQAHLPVPWPIEWELQTPPGLVVPYMALSREGKGARLRYSLPLDCTQDTAPGGYLCAFGLPGPLRLFSPISSDWG